MSFVKLDCKILYSSIWAESPETKTVWITMLALADQNGIVPATAPGISLAAVVSLEATRKALAIFESPDPDSKSLENRGRRIERVDGGYKVLNYESYRAFNYSMNPAAIKKRRQRECKKETGDIKGDNVPTISGHSASASASESVSEEEEKKETIQKKKDIDIFYDHLLNVLKITPSDKKKTEALLKLHGLEKMLAAVNRMRFYFDSVKSNKWTEYIIGRHWRNLHEKINYFISDENLDIKMTATAKSNKGIFKKPETDYEKEHKYDDWNDLNIEAMKRLQRDIADYELKKDQLDQQALKKLESWKRQLLSLEEELADLTGEGEQ